MSNRMTFLAAALAGGTLMALSSGAQAVPAVVASATPHTIVVQTPPPAPFYEPAPAPRHGWVWSPGHYEWRNGRYVWITGQWMPDRPGWDWVEARWVQQPDGSWRMVGGYWMRDEDERRASRFGPNGDMDHDGIRNADDDDRDGDGVANWDDDFPSNRQRS